MFVLRFKLLLPVVLASWFLTLALALPAGLSPVSYARPLFGTTIGSDITGPATWDLAGSPYTITTDITVVSGATLTIEPGVTVKGQLGVELLVAGHLQAEGTAAQPITFTSEQDSGPTQWGGLLFNGGTGNLSHVTVRHGGNPNTLGRRGNLIAQNVLSGQLVIESSRILRGTDGGGSADYGIFIDDSRVTISDTLVAYNGNSVSNSYGLYAATGSSTLLTVTNSRFLTNTGTGLSFDTASGTAITVTNSVFQNNSHFGMYVDPGVNAWVSGSTFSNNGAYPLQVDARNLHQVLSGGNTFFGNTPDLLLTRGTMQANVTLAPANGLAGFELDDDVIVPAGITLTVNPGTILYGQPGSELRVSGHMVALGIATNPITFTSTADTGGGQWSGLVVDGGTAHFRYATIRYGGETNSRAWRSNLHVQSGSQITIENSRILTGSDGAASASDYGLLVNNSRVVISNSHIAGNGDQPADFGILVSGTTPVVTITDSCIINNNGAGISLSSGSPQLSISTSDISGNSSGLESASSVTANAQLNWWGHPGGPTHAANPIGQGQIITGLVDYNSWLDEPICNSYLRLSKQGPDSAIAGQPITYTLTLFNRSGITATNVVITDVVPAGATFIQALDGGQLVGGQVVSWVVPSLAGYSSTSRRFVITAAQSIINQNYRAGAADGSTAPGIIPLETTVVSGGSGVFDDSGQKLGGGNSRAVAVGDINGDGFPDVVVANGSPNQSWINDGSGVFTTSVPSFGDESSQAIVLGDVNGDGFADAIVGNNGSNQIWINDGSGTFTGTVGLGGDDTRTVALGDLNGDGTLDAFVGNATGGQVWANDGSGVFGPLGIPLNMVDTQAVVVDDVDADGDLDIFAGTGAGQFNQIWLNDGTGVFTDSQTLDSNNSRAIAMGDLNGDGFPDAVVGTGAGQPNQVWLNNGAGVFNLHDTLGLSATQAVALGDLDADDDLDLIIGSDGPNEIWLNTGTGIFSSTGQTLNISNTQGIAVGDFDSDGDLDLFFGNDSGQANTVFINLNPQTKLIDRLTGGAIDDSNFGLTTTVQVPAGGLAQPTTFNYSFLLSPTPPIPATLRFANRAFRLEALQNGQPVTNPFGSGGSMTVTMHYNPDQVDNADTLRIYYRDAGGQWLDAAATCPVASNYVRMPHYVAVAICHLTEFGLFEQTQSGSSVYLPVVLKQN